MNNEEIGRVKKHFTAQFSVDVYLTICKWKMAIIEQFR